MVVTAVAVVNRDDGVIIAIVEVLRSRRLAPGNVRVNRMRTFAPDLRTEKSSQGRPVLNRLSADFGDRARDSLTRRRVDQSALIWL